MEVLLCLSYRLLEVMDMDIDARDEKKMMETAKNDV